MQGCLLQKENLLGSFVRATKWRPMRSLSLFALSTNILIVILSTVILIRLMQKVFTRRQSLDPLLLELLRSCYYLEGFYIIRSVLLLHVGLLDKRFNEALGYDLALRCTEAARRVCRVPRVLYHVRYSYSIGKSTVLTDSVRESGRRALVEHCKRVGIKAEIMALDKNNCYQIRHVLVARSSVLLSLFQPRTILRC